MTSFSPLYIVNHHLVYLTAFWLLLELVLSDCPLGWKYVDSSCYGVLEESSPFPSMYAARQLCFQHGADLASFPDNITQYNVSSTLITDLQPTQALRPQYVYIGLADVLTVGDFEWMDNTTLSYSDFSGGETGEHCVALQSPDKSWPSTGDNTFWTDVPCCFQQHDIKTVICKKPFDDNITVPIESDVLHSYCTGDCPPGWYRWKENCYSLLNITAPNSAYEARQQCLSYSADLPSVVNATIEQHIASIIRTLPQASRPTAVYISANDISQETIFKHLNDTLLAETGYSNWGTDEPDSYNVTVFNETQNCVLLESVDGSWNNDALQQWSDVPCCESVGVQWVICEKPIDSNVSLSSPDADIFAWECYGEEDDCVSVPCTNGATCEDHVLSYNCSCVPGYSGVNCETEINFCLSMPCQNGGTCERYLNGYNCSCPYGYTGIHCETLWWECISNPCQNNATCVDGHLHYNCSCVFGFTGVHCETNIDECANRTCQNGGSCEDGIGSAVCLCPTGFTGADCETELSCLTSVLDAMENVTKTNESNPELVDGWVTYECLPGYKYPDMDRVKTFTCTALGSYTPTPEGCQQHCDYVPYVANADVANANTKVGNTVNYTCNYGYQFEDNTTVLNITCEPPGNWSIDVANISQCEIVRCPELIDYPYQDVDTYNNTFNTTVTFWCDVGYVLHDNTTARTIKCLADGEWTATLPPCQPIKCPFIELQDHQTRNTSTNIYNTYSHYKCDKGYRLLDGSIYRIIKCDANGEWSDNITDCRADRCFPLPYVANATPSTTDADFDTVSILTCIKGHRFNPGKLKTRKMTCLHNGWWNPILSQCEPILCKPIPRSINTLPSTENQLFGTVVEYWCLLGHYIYPDMDSMVAIECQENEQWNNTNIPDCWPIVCPLPPDIDNGTRILPPDLSYNYTALVNYECDGGFKFIDGRIEKNLYCNEFGEWNDTDVSCRKDRCDPVPRPTNTWPDTTNTSWYTNVTYQCDIGHEWPDNKTTHNIMCKAGGEWSETTTIPACTIKECELLSQMPNSTLNDTVNHVYDTWVEYECDIGYKYEDNDTIKPRWCSDQALWEPQDFPECQIIHCPELEEVENATRDSNETFYNNVVNYDCNIGYQYPDKSLSKSIRCTANETWTEYPPPCEVVFCPPVPYWDEADFNSTDNAFLAVVSYKCQVNYSFADSVDIPDAEKISVCLESKRWDPPFDDCMSMYEINADIKGKTWESPEGVPIGTVACSLLCVVLGLIVLLDLNKLWQDLKMMRRNIKSCVKRHSRNKISDSSQNLKSSEGSPPKP